LVMSAGVAAMMGGKAAQEAIETMQELGLDLHGHETQPLTEPLVRHADMIYTMTAAHRDAIVCTWPSAAERTRMLNVDGSEICDPIGSSVACYRRCAAEIQAQLKARLKELPLPPKSTGR
jgi:protein-tyrosine-phosphatase